MNDQPRVCVIGSCNLDLTFRTPYLPRPGETMAGTSFQRGFGGKGANQAVMAARAGAEVSLISRIGADDFGRDARSQLQAQGIDVRHLSTDPDRPTGVAVILVEDDGQNAIVGVAGANAALSVADVEAAADTLRSARVVVAPFEVPIEAITAGFRIAAEAGAITILNPAPAWPIPEELLAVTHLIVPNETELHQLTDCPTDTIEEVGEAAQRLFATLSEPMAVIVTRGERGALLLWTPDAHGYRTIAYEYVPAFPVTAVDTSGAGDAFIGCLAAGLAEQIPLPQAVRRASAAAGLSVTQAGTQSSYPDRATLEAFLAAPPISS